MKHRIFGALGAAVLLAGFAGVAVAQQQQIPDQGFTPPTLEQLLQKLPGSFTGLFGNSSTLTPVNLNPSSLQVSPQSIQGVQQKLDAWFMTNTGMSLTHILGAIFQFLVWLTTLAIELIKWLLSLVGVH